jgi:hypothetical protein
MGSDRFLRLTGGRTKDQTGVEIEGGQDFGRRVLDNLAFTI